MAKKEDLRVITLKQVVARNVQALLDRNDKDRRGQHSRFVKAHPDVPLSKIQRAVKDGKIGLETVEQLAKIFKIQPYQMLLRDLNVHEPQVAVEMKRLNAIKQMSKELAEELR